MVGVKHIIWTFLLIFFVSTFAHAQATGCIGATENFTCGDIINESCTLNAHLSSSDTCFTINTSDVVVDCAGYWINGTDSWPTKGVYVNRSHNVTVRNCRLTDWYEGIYLDRSHNGTFENNTVLSSTYYGVRLNRARGNTLVSNELNSTGANNLAFQTSSVDDYNNSIDATNTVFGVPVSYHFRNCTGLDVADEVLTHLSLIDCRNVTVRNVTVTDADGIWLAYVNDSVLSESTLSGNYINLYLGYSQNLTVAGNTLVNSSKQYGLQIQSVDESSVTDNVIRHNTMHGIYARSSDNVTLTNNTVCDNGGESSSYYDISQGSSDTLEGTGNLCTTTENYNDTGAVNCTHPCLGCVGAIDIHICGDSITESCMLNGNLSSSDTCLSVAGDDLVVDGAGYSLTGNGTYGSSGIAANGRLNVTVKNVVLVGYMTGINLRYTNGSLISNNSCTGCSLGIGLWHADDNDVTGNTVVGGDFAGARVYAAAHNRFTDNAFTANTIGVTLDPDSDNNTFIANNVSNSVDQGIHFSSDSNDNTLAGNFVCGNAVDVNDSDSNTGTGNTCDTTVGYNDTAYDGCATTCNGSTGIFTGGCVGATETFVCGDTINESCTLNADLSANGTCLTLGADSITVDGAGHLLTGNGTSWGVYAANLENIVIKNFNLTDFYTGIHILGGDNITLRNNTASNNSYYGLYLRDAENSRVAGNAANGNSYGILLQALTQNAVNNSFVNNTANDNLYRGLSLSNNTNAPNLYNSTGNTVTGNTFCNNNPAGSPDHADLWDDDANTGDNNTCDSVGNWNDEGTTGCTSSCACNCKSCAECETKLNGNECSTVSLIRDVNHANISSCIADPSNIHNKTFDCQGHILTGPGSQYGIYQNSNNGTTIKNCVLQNWGKALYASNTFQSIFENNTVTHSTMGIEVEDTYFTTLEGNTVRDCTSICISVDTTVVGGTNSSHALITNTATNCSLGYRFWRSYNNTVSGNTADNCTDEGFHLYHSGDNTLTNNNATSNDKGIYLRSDANGNTLTGNVVIENDVYGIHLEGSDENTLSDNNAWGNDEGGIVLQDSHNNTFAGDVANMNTGGNDHGGFMLDSSHDNTLTAVTGSGNSVEGLYLNYSERTVIADSTFDNNTGGGVGIVSSPDTTLRNCTVTDGYTVALRSSDRATLADNTVANNSHYGIYCYYSNHSTFSSNVLDDNREVGLYTVGCSNATIEDNTLTGNDVNGIFMHFSSNNNTLTSNTITGTGCASTFHISQEIGSSLWAERYTQAFETAYTTKSFAFTALADELTLRITQRDTPFAGIEAAELTACSNPVAPDYAVDAETGESVLEDILAADLNVTCAHERVIEISWPMPTGCDSAVLALTANEYGPGTPVRSPPQGTVSLIRKESTTPHEVDGVLAEVDGILQADYAPVWKPTTGHPRGTTYLYVTEDDDTLYLSLDITCDNTHDADEDWLELTLAGDATAATFRIDDTDDRYGRCSFGMTSKAAYNHQSCEAAIPKDELPAGDLALSIRYYGTVASTIAGIYANNADNNTFTDNTVNSNCGYGVYLAPTSTGNTLTNNTFCSNSLADIIDLDSNTGDLNACANATGWTDASASSGCVNPCTSTQNTTFYTGWNLYSLWVTP